MTTSKNGISSMAGKGKLSWLLLGAALLPAAGAQAQSSLASLSGQYAFYLTGQEQRPSDGLGLEAIAGSFNADGHGHITSGVLDQNSSSGLVQVSSLTGAYTLDATTGKGTVTLQLPTGPLNVVFYTQLPLPAPNSYYAPIDAAIVAAGGSLLGGSGRLANAIGGSYPAGATFSLNGENASGGGAVSGLASLKLINKNGTEQVTGQAELIDNGKTSYDPGVTGTADPVDATGRFTVSLAGMGSGTAHYAAYQGDFRNGSTIFLSLDPHGSAPLLVGNDGANIPSYVIQYGGTENF